MPFKNALTSYRNPIGSALTLFVVLLGATTHLDAKPFIFYRGVVHAASFAPPGSPAGVIPQGGLFSIFGKEIGPAEAAQVTAFPLGAELAGVGVTVTQDDTVVDAIPVFVRAGQVNVIMPSDAPLGEVSIRVTFNGETSNPVRVTVVAHGPGIFTANQFGIGPGIVQNFIAADNRPTNSNRVTAQRGQLVTIWLTGLGAIEGADNQAPPVGTLPYEVEVFFGGVKATQIDYAGRAPCCSAVDQVNALIPLETPTGCFVSLTVRVNGAVSNTVTMAIGEDPAACADPHNPFSETLVSGGKQGNVVLLRQEFLDETVGARPFEHTLDVFSAQFTDYPGGPFAFNPNNSLPPPGSCTSYTFQGDILEDATVAATASGALTAGSIAVTTPAGVVQATAIPPAMTLYAALLGHTIDIVDFPTVPLKLEPGGATVTANGGDVGAFEADVTITAPVTWTNRAALDSINRANGVRFEWQGEAQVILAGMSTEMASNSSGVFLCVASPGATSFDVPDYALTNLPRSRFTRAQTRAYLLLLSMPPNQPTEFEADGLDYGGAVVIHAQMLGTVVR